MVCCSFLGSFLHILISSWWFAGYWKLNKRAFSSRVPDLGLEKECFWRLFSWPFQFTTVMIVLFIICYFTHTPHTRPCTTLFVFVTFGSVISLPKFSSKNQPKTGSPWPWGLACLHTCTWLTIHYTMLPREAIERVYIIRICKQVAMAMVKLSPG
jgi:hypothetical protein